MCGRYVSPNQAAIERHWHLGRDKSNPFAERYNVAPQQGNPAFHVPVIRNDREGTPELAMMQWWLLPYWSKQPRVNYSTFNARIETVATAAAFRGPFQRRRCLIPALGWYEWQPVGSGKQPWYMHAANGELLHFAGVWDRWKGQDRTIESCSIIVGEPHPALARLHDRMPIVLRPEVYSAWLDRSRVDVENVKELLQPVTESAIAFHKVSTRVGNSRNEGPELIEAVEN
jgi:putative SOS response-associated peptidase YedK